MFTVRAATAHVDVHVQHAALWHTGSAEQSIELSMLSQLLT